MLDEEGLQKAASIVKGGGIIAFPTDTVYGLGCDPRNARAVRRLFEVKRREGKPIPVLCDSMESAKKVASFNRLASVLARRHWPGALTLVLPMKVPFPYEIHQGTGEVGVRVPSPPGLGVAERCGGYITGTSANTSGRPPAKSAEDAFAELGHLVDLILDGGKLRGEPSTIARVSGTRIEVLRKGALNALG